MQFDTENMVANEIRKGALLIARADQLDMDLGGYGQVGVNPHSGNVYLWLEDYPFCLYIGLGSGDRIFACWSNPETGEEEITEVTEGTRFGNLEEWAETLNAQVSEEA